jgi:tRNA (guanosine-2'-O-)-methyltransferase
VLATLPSEGSHSLFNLDLTIPTAIIFGNEDDGLSAEAIALCDGFFTIPQAGFAESLNISVACAVTLYEAYRQRDNKGFYTNNPQLDSLEQEALFQRWAKKVKTAKYHNRGIAIDEQSPDIIPVFAARPSLT